MVGHLVGHLFGDLVGWSLGGLLGWSLGWSLDQLAVGQFVSCAYVFTVYIQSSAFLEFPTNSF